MASDTILIELGKLSNLAKDCSDALLATDKTSEEKLELVSSKITELNFALQVGGYYTVSIFGQESIPAQLLGAKFRVIGAATLSVSSAQLIKSTANWNSNKNLENANEIFRSTAVMMQSLGGLVMSSSQDARSQIIGICLVGYGSALLALNDSSDQYLDLSDKMATLFTDIEENYNRALSTLNEIYGLFNVGYNYFALGLEKIAEYIKTY